MAPDFCSICNVRHDGVAIQACGPMAHIWSDVVFFSRRMVDIETCLRYSHNEGLNSVWL